MESQNKLLAIKLCYDTKQPVDIFLASDGKEKFALTNLRNSKKYINRLTYENNAVIIRDSKGELLEPLQEVSDKKTSKRSTKNNEQSEGYQPQDTESI